MSILQEASLRLFVVVWCVAVHEAFQIRIDVSNRIQRQPAGVQIFRQRGIPTLAGGDQSSGAGGQRDEFPEMVLFERRSTEVNATEGEIRGRNTRPQPS